MSFTKTMNLILPGGGLFEGCPIGTAGIVAAAFAAMKAAAIQTSISANCMWNSDNCNPANFTVPAGATVTFWAEGTWLTHPHGPDGGRGMDQPEMVSQMRGNILAPTQNHAW